VQNTATGRWTAIPGGFGNVASADYSAAFGALNTASGQYSLASGTGAVADLYAVQALAGGTVASGRRAQKYTIVMRAVSAANVTPVRLTGDGLAAGAANVLNLTYSGEAMAIRVQVAAGDATAANMYVWSQPLGILRRNGTVGTTTYAGSTATNLSVGTTTGIAITESADTVNGGYNLTFTPPTGNASVWRVVATIEATRVDVN
jgi:hypothetical protein